MFLARDGRLPITLDDYWALEPALTGALVRLVSDEAKEDARSDGELKTAEMAGHQAGYQAIVTMLGALGRALAGRP